MSDKKDAVNIGVTLSTQLIAVALAMIAVLATFAAYTIDKKTVDGWYFFTIGCAFFSFVISIMKGGKGIDKARKSGFNSNWNLDDTKSSFNLQALFCLIGVFLFIGSIFFGKNKDDEFKLQIINHQKKIIQLEITDSLSKLEQVKLNNRIDSLQKIYSKKPKSKTYKRVKKCCETIIIKNIGKDTIYKQ